MYKLSLEPGTGFLTATVTGFWTMEIAERYIAELVKLKDDFHRKGLPFRMLLDARDSAIQSPTVMARLQESRESTSRAGEKIAIVVASTLARIQTGRTTQGAGNMVSIFTSPVEARAWLLDDDALD
jgi:hypothetical protein